MNLSLLSKKVFNTVAIMGFTGVVLVGCQKPAETTTQTDQPANTDTTATVATDTTTNTGLTTKDPQKDTIVIGTTEGDFADMVRNQVKAELEAQGYKVELKTFTDYVMPNQALASGDLDINIFQHKPYLDTFKAEHNLDLVEVFQVPTAPLGVYAGNKTALTDAFKGMKVSAPNDPSNFARALVMMADLGWITLNDGIDPLKATKADIKDNSKYEINIVELEAANLPRTRNEVDFAIINGNYATDAGIKLTESLFQEKSFAYINWSAIKTADKDKPWVQHINNAYNSDAFKTYAHNTFPGYKYPKIWGEQMTSELTPSTTSEAVATTDKKTTNWF